MFSRKTNINLFLLLGLLLFATNLKAQDADTDYSKLTMNKAIAIGLKNNNGLAAEKIDVSIALDKEKKAIDEKYPELDLEGTYSRVTNLNQYENGGIFSNPTSYKLERAMYEYGVGASMALYNGGKLNNEVKISKLKTSIATIRNKKNEKQLKLEIITSFMKINHLFQQKKLIDSKIYEDSLNINQTLSMVRNGVVTKNEVLRAKLQRSNHKMFLTTIINDIEIEEHQLITLLALPEETILHIDKDDIDNLNVEASGLEENLTNAETQNDDISLANETEKIKVIEKKMAKGNYMPHISLLGKYGYNYPNYKFFPPEPYLYTLGFIGLNATFSLSGLIKNQRDVSIANKEIDQQKLITKEIKEKTNHKVFIAYQKLKESDEKIVIAQESVAQAAENYRIVKTKYGNNLSLITELIDADNAYLESQSTLITNQIERKLKYYQLQFAIGTL